MSEPDPNLRVLLSILDGQDVDWMKAENVVRDAGGRRAFHGLRTLQWIAAGSRSGDEGPAETGAEGEAGHGKLGAALGPLFTWGDLLALHKIGEGSYADVYLAWEQRLRRCVALKLIKPRVPGAETSLAEGQLLAQVRNQRVVQVFGADVHHGRAGLWMELIEGRTLADMVERDGPLGPAEAALVAREVSKGLSSIHRHGLIHGDVKAGNVMRAEGGRIVLMDFGSALWLGEVHSAKHGTPLYMAPELLRGGRPSPQSDLYSLGVLLYYMVTGRHPVEAERLEELLSAHQQGRRTRLQQRRPELPDAFVDIVDRALEYPERRFSSAGETDAMLRAFLSGTTPLSGVGRAPRRPFVVLGLSVVTIVVLVWVAQRWTDSPFSRVTAPERPAASEEPLIATTQLYALREGIAVPLQSGHLIAPGDRLFLKLLPAREAFVYVLNQDHRDAAYLLYPLPGLEPQNPLPPGESVRLPGSRQDQPMYWQVTSAGGLEHLLIVATSRRQKEIEAEMEHWELPSDWQGTALPLSPPAVGRFRGIAGLVEGERRTDGLASRLRRVESVAQSSADSWSLHLVLANPPP